MFGRCAYGDAVWFGGKLKGHVPAAGVFLGMEFKGDARGVLFGGGSQGEAEAGAEEIAQVVQAEVRRAVRR